MDIQAPLLDTEGGVAVLSGAGSGSAIPGVGGGVGVNSGTPTQTRKAGLGLLSPAALASSITSQFSSSPFSTSLSGAASAQETSSTNISSCQWTKILPADCNSVSNALSLPSERIKHCACFYKKSIYIFSGKNGNTTLRDLWRFDIPTRTWEKLKWTSRPEPRGVLDATMSASRGHLYLFGGELGWKNPEETSVWIFNLESCEWTQWQPPPGSPGPTNRRSHSAVVYHSGLFVYGGYIDLRGSSAQLWQYNLKTPSWRCVHDGSVQGAGSNTASNNQLGGQLTSTASPSPRHDHSAIVYNHSMWIYGGISNLNLLNDLWVWNFEVTQWSQVWSGSGGRGSPRERYGHSASLVGYGATRAMMIVGGQQAQCVSPETWTFNFACRQWTRISPGGGGRQTGATHSPLPRTGHVAIQANTNAEEEDEGFPRRDLSHFSVSGSAMTKSQSHPNHFENLVSLEPLKPPVKSIWDKVLSRNSVGSISVPAMSQRPGSRRSQLSSSSLGNAPSPQLAKQKTLSTADSPSHGANVETKTPKAKSPGANEKAPGFSFPPVDIFTANAEVKSWNKFAAGMNASTSPHDSGTTTVELIRLNSGPQSQSLESLAGLGGGEAMEETPATPAINQHAKVPLIPPPKHTGGSHLKRQTSSGRRERRSKSREGLVSRKSTGSCSAAGLLQPSSGWSSNVVCFKGGEGFGKLQNHFNADSEKKSGFRNPAYMVDKDAETGERSSPENRTTPAGDSGAADSAADSSAKSADVKSSTELPSINDLNLLADLNLNDSSNDPPLISLTGDSSQFGKKSAQSSSRILSSLSAAQNHPLMTSCAEELSVGAVLKPTSIANQNLKLAPPTPHGLGANFGDKKQMNNINNFSIPGQVQRSGRNSISSEEDNTCVPFEDDESKASSRTSDSRQDNLLLLAPAGKSPRTPSPSPNFYVTDLAKGAQTKLLTRSNTGSSISPSFASNRPFSAGEDSLFIFDVDSSSNSDYSQYLPKENPFLACSDTKTTPTSSSASASSRGAPASSMVPPLARTESAASSRPKTGDSGFHDDPGAGTSMEVDEIKIGSTVNPFDPKLLQLSNRDEEEEETKEDKEESMKEEEEEEEEEEEDDVGDLGGTSYSTGTGEEWMEMSLSPNKSKANRSKPKTVVYLFGGRQGDSTRSISFAPLQLWRCDVEP